MIYYWYQLGTLFPILSVPELSRTKTPQGPPLELIGNESNKRLPPESSSGTEPIYMPRILPSNMSTLTIDSLKFGEIKVLHPNIFVILSLGALFMLLVLRWLESGHFPLSNLYESLIFLSFCCTCLHFITQIYMFSTAKFSSLVLTLIGSITSSSALLINAFASFSLPETMQQGGPLVPSLQSNWLMMHVTVMILSYAALIIGSLLSICYLVFSEYATMQNRSSGSLKSSNQSVLNSMASIERILFNFDNLSYRIIGLGFPLLTIGILSGAVWANEAWGSFWSWDPKETWALLTWLIFAIYLHTRITRGWQGKTSAIMASIGFLTVWVCFLGVNLLGEGLHSYGFMVT
jgi:cytochrome c-type biogenesis protein CcsB